MKIGIDIQTTLKKITGIGQYVLGLVNGLSKIDKDNEYYLYCRKSFISRRKKIPKFKSPNFHYRIDRIGRGLSNIIKGVDVLYTPSQHIIPKDNYKFISTIHDLVAYKFPEKLSEDTVERSRKEFKRCLEISDCVVVPSKNTRKDIGEIFGEKFKDKIKVVYPGVDSKFRKLPRDEVRKVLSKHSLEEGYVLFVGTIEPRKNLVNLIKALHILKKKNSLPSKLVVAGSKGWGWKEVKETVNKLRMEDDIIFMDYVDSGLIPYLYNGAKVFVYPSQYEGFGFPIAEAIACETPVITSKGSSCEEVAGDAGLLVDPFNEEEISNAIGNLYGNKDLYHSISDKTRTRKDFFYWEYMSKNMLKVFQHLV